MTGVLVSDDLSMGALGGGLGERAQRALDAGCDLVLHCNGDPAEMAEIVAATGRYRLRRQRGSRAARRCGTPPIEFDRPEAERAVRCADGGGAVMGGAASLAATIYQATTWVLPVIFAVTFHEAAHGFVALRFGDDTALRARRVTFNPLNHIDPFGTMMLPALLLLASGGRFLFGYAKPVPVNFGRLAPSAARHGVGGAGRAGHQRAAGDHLVAVVLRGGLYPAEPGRMVGAQSGSFAQHQRGAVRLQHAAVAAASTAAGSRSACCRARSPIRWPGSSRTAC